MLNPDGVINGHYRCSLAGQDLNRYSVASRCLESLTWIVEYGKILISRGIPVYGTQRIWWKMWSDSWLVPDSKFDICWTVIIEETHLFLRFPWSFHQEECIHVLIYLTRCIWIHYLCRYGCDPNACFPGKVPVHQWKNPNSPCNFPMIMNEISTAFSFQDCDFRMHKSKLTTGRVVVYRWTYWSVRNCWAFKNMTLWCQQGIWNNTELHLWSFVLGS